MIWRSSTLIRPCLAFLYSDPFKSDQDLLSSLPRFAKIQQHLGGSSLDLLKSSNTWLDSAPIYSIPAIFSEIRLSLHSDWQRSNLLTPIIVAYQTWPNRPMLSYAWSDSTRGGRWSVVGCGCLLLPPNLSGLRPKFTQTNPWTILVKLLCT